MTTYAKKRIPRPADIRKHKHGWLRPDGKFFACDRSGHLDLLDDLGVHWLEADNAGWCKVATGGDGSSFFYVKEGKATQSQINAIDRHCEAFKVELPWWAGGK